MLPFKLVYHDGYDLNLGAHVFPSQKFKLIAETLLADGIATNEDFLRPAPASDEDILRVHTADWVKKLKTGTLTLSEQMKLEVPYSPELVNAFWLAAGGTIAAAQAALRDGFGCNLGGGFHHAYPGHGEGFCAIHDVAVAIRRLQHDGAIHKAMVVDTDVHHGNGTAAIFSDDRLPSSLSPSINSTTTPRTNLASTSRSQYGRWSRGRRLSRKLFCLQSGTASIISSPDMVFYVGGADPYRDDQLGGLDSRWRV